MNPSSPDFFERLHHFFAWFSEHTLFGIPADSIAHFTLGFIFFLIFRALKLNSKKSFIGVIVLSILKEIIFDLDAIFYSGKYFDWISDIGFALLGCWLGLILIQKIEKIYRAGATSSGIQFLSRLFKPVDSDAEENWIKNRNSGSREQFIAIGDIHCQAHLLKALLETIESQYLTASTSIIFLGDYIDRSKDLEQCEQTFRLLTEFAHRYPKQVFFLRGNHEFNFIDSETNDIDQIGETQDYERLVYKKYRSFIFSTFPFYENEHYFFAHAGGIMTNGSFARSEDSPSERKALYWRYNLTDKDYGRTIVRGHQIVSPEQMFGKHVINVDLGSYKTGMLGAVLLPQRIPIIVQAEATS